MIRKFRSSFRDADRVDKLHKRMHDHRQDQERLRRAAITAVVVANLTARGAFSIDAADWPSVRWSYHAGSRVDWNAVPGVWRVHA